MARTLRDEDGEKYVTLEEVTCLRDSGKALLCIIQDEERWVPQSLIGDDSEVFDSRDNATGKLVVERWWAERERLG